MIPISRFKAMLASAVAAACLTSASATLAADAQMAGGTQPEEPAGYLKPGELPDSVALLPPPPALGSAAEALDQDIAREMLKLRGSERFRLAGLDADLDFPEAAGTFSCALGAAVTERDTPTLYRILRRVKADAGAATGASKNKYRHARPFMLDGEPTCVKSEDEEELRKNGSYPSGHTSIGWAWAEVLAEIAPDRADAILERGRAFGESRLVCNVHWASDVREGRMIATATVARLHASPEFLADAQAAKLEVEAARKKGLRPQRDCRFEAEALKEKHGWTP
ncbi:MAG TPA: phosphatase PAP2 family protein [Methylocystis sp.]|nr:phosphatase PAP2 family protein [Methylocystis sp.]